MTDGDRIDAVAGDLIERVRRAADEQAICQLVARYCIAADDRDFATLASLFTRDASFGSSFGDVRGRDAIIDLLRHVLGRFGTSVHYSQPPVIDWINADRARGVVSTHSELDVSGRYVVTSFRYFDTYAREDGLWRFQRRSTETIYVLQPHELPQRFSGNDRVRWPPSTPAE